jgi:hypothetical protein
MTDKQTGITRLLHAADEDPLFDEDDRDELRAVLEEHLEREYNRRQSCPSDV